MDTNRLSKQKFDADTYKRDFYRFVKAGYPHLGLGKFVDGWHIELLCKALTYLYEGKFPSNRLLINVPPGHMKSLLTSVFYPLWIWTKEPNKRFMFLSYADSRSYQDSGRRRVLFFSEWYQSLYPLSTTPAGDNQSRLINTEGGSFFASGFYGQLTGEHCDIQVLDDVLNADDRFSEPVLKKMYDIYDNILPSRFSDPATGKRVIICQRLSDRDLVGHILDKGEVYEQIILPEKYDGERYYTFYPELQDKRNKVGQLLWKEKFPSKVVENLQFMMTSIDVSGQYQQRAKALEGNLFKREWFSHREENFEVTRRFIFADTASSIKGDYSSIMVIEVMPDERLFIRDIRRGRWEFNDLAKNIKDMIEKWSYALEGVWIEDKNSGTQILQTMRDTVGYLLYPYQPEGAKEERAKLQLFWCEHQRVVLPPPSDIYPWLLDFENELYVFPNGKNDDMVDCLTMGLSVCSNILSSGYRATQPRNDGVIIHDEAWAVENQKYLDKYGMSKEMFQRLSGYDY
jgi:predicted phage terminase large subunit-like protein